MSLFSGTSTSRAREGSIGMQLLKLRNVSTALMQQLNMGAAASEYTLEGAPSGAVPRMERVDTEDRIGCWLVHNHVEFDQSEVIDNVDACDVWVKSCGWNGESAELPGSETNLAFMGETRFVCIESCTSLRVGLDNVVDGVLIKDCSNMAVYLGGENELPPITMESCVGVEIIKGPKPLGHNLETVDCCGCMVSTVSAAFMDSSCIQLMADLRREPTLIPDRLMTTLQHGAMITIAQTKGIRDNKALLAMATNENIVELDPPIQ